MLKSYAKLKIVPDVKIRWANVEHDRNAFDTKNSAGTIAHFIIKMSTIP